MAGGDSERGAGDLAGSGALGLDPGARVRDLIGRARNLGAQADTTAPHFTAPDELHADETVFVTDEAGHDHLDLGERDRLPWLESDDDEDYTGVDARRVVVAVAAGLALMASIVGGVWYVSHRKAAGAPVADGSLIQAPVGPWREAPKDPGGKQFDGTGDTSFAVSQGQNRPAQLAANDGDAQAGANAAEAAASTAAAAGASFAGGAPAAKPEAKPASAAAKPTADAGASGPAGGVVQIAAYTSQSQAEGGWNKLVIAHEIMKGMNHRIVSAKIDLGTVYRLQIVTSAGGGHGLCDRLKADGVACQVKH